MIASFAVKRAMPAGLLGIFCYLVGCGSDDSSVAQTQQRELCEAWCERTYECFAEFPVGNCLSACLLVLPPDASSTCQFSEFTTIPDSEWEAALAEQMTADCADLDPFRERSRCPVSY